MKQNPCNVHVKVWMIDWKGKMTQFVALYVPALDIRIIYWNLILPTAQQHPSI